MTLCETSRIRNTCIMPLNAISSRINSINMATARSFDISDT